MESAGHRRTGILILLALVIFAGLGLLAMGLYTAILVHQAEHDH